ncbi:MAG: hypothetical protein JWP52_1094 [Rhizobacter sp.]|nr:hypothetical protein [Rhizobacter sp.]
MSIFDFDSGHRVVVVGGAAQIAGFIAGIGRLDTLIDCADIAGSAVLASKAAHYITGTVLAVDGGFLAV